MKIFDFGEGVPECVTAGGGRLSVTALAVKQGTGSLRWDFNAGDQLVFDGDIGYRQQIRDGKDNRAYAFSVYLYGIGATGKLKVDFYQDDVWCTGFEVILDFDGWRSISACFDRDMNGVPREGMNQMVITADGGGSLLFSELVTANRIDARAIWKSYQVPEVKYDALNVIKDWKLGAAYRNAAPAPEAVKAIREKVKTYIYSEYVNGKPVNPEELEAKLAALSITRNELGITGKRVEYQIHRRILIGTEWEKEEYANLRTVTNLMLSLAVWYAQTKSERAASAYLEVMEYLMVQGFAEGSSFGTHWILFYGLRPLYTSVALMWDVIEKSPLAADFASAMLWFQHVIQMGFCDEVPARKASSDSFFNDARGILNAILMIQEPVKQAGFLTAFRDWIERNLKLGEGLLGILKEDGCIYHHCGHYIAYGNGGLEGITTLIYALSGTPFAVSNEVCENVRRVLEAIHFQCHGVNVPIVFSGRHPLGKMQITAANYKYFALAMLEAGNDRAKEIATMYVSLKQKPEDDLDRKLFTLAENAVYEDNRSFPLACACVHKRENFMAVAKGYSRYLWGSEIYEANNLYGRYRSYGVVELINERSHFSHDGYDWNRFPGATTIHLPMEKLRANVLNVDTHSGFEEMLLSDQSFAGSVSLHGNGMFSMILSEHPKYNGTHRAHKSVFFHDDFILLLGSGISNEAEYETETTLYQISREAAVDAPKINGERVGELRYEIKEGDVLTDSFGNDYYIKPGTTVQVSCGEQVSKSSTDDSETRGEFATAVICHGISPKDATYEYGIGVNGAKKPDYQILRQDDAVHAVKIGNVTYAAIFRSEVCEQLKVNRPILLMAEESADGITLAVCDPDLGLYDEDPTQFDENGVQKEVSIYSRKWQRNPVGVKRLKLEAKKIGLVLDQEVRGGTIHELIHQHRGEEE